MATKGMIDSSIGAFWAAAGSPRPTTPRDLIRRNSRPRVKRGAATSVPLSARRPTGGSEKESEAHPELRQITIELKGREGFNALAINGVWRFWQVKAGKLAFRRDADLEAEDDSDPEASGPGIVQKGGGRADKQQCTVRLYLFYLPQADAWLVNDAPDSVGNVVADCGPVANGEDLGQHWRVWDGEGWREDRNITAEVFLGGPAPPTLQGLRVVAAPGQASARVRAHSQDTRPPPQDTRPPPLPVLPRPPTTARPPESARIMRTPRGGV